MPARQPPPRSTAALWAGLFMMSIVSRISEVVPLFTHINVTRILFAFTAIAVFMNRSVQRVAAITSITLGRFTIAFFVLVAFSVPLSIYISNSLKVIEGVMITFLGLLLIVRALRTPQDIFLAFRFLAAAAVISTVSLLLAYKGGRAKVGGSYDPNDIAYVLVTLLPIVAALAAQVRSLARLAWLALAFLMVLCIALTGSRGGLVALMVFGASWCRYPIALAKGGGLVKSSLGSALARAALLVVVFLFVLSIIPGDNKARLMSLFSVGSDYNMSMTDNSSRMLVWYRDLQAVLARPIGYGVGSAPVVDGMVNGGHFKTAHNSVVQVAVELGLGGLFVFVSVYYFALKGVATAGPLLPPVAGTAASVGLLYARALRTALVCNLSAGLFLSQGYAPVLWCLVSVCIAMIRSTTPVRTAITAGAAATTVAAPP